MEEYKDEQLAERTGSRKRRISGEGRRRQYRKVSASSFFDEEAVVVDSDVEEEQEQVEDDFFIEGGADLSEEDDVRSMRSSHSHMLQHNLEDDEDLEAIAKSIQERYGRYRTDYHEQITYEEITDVEQQALLPSVRDPKLWRVKCVFGRGRETAVHLMHKGSKLQIKSAIALNHVKNYIYVEADKEAHVREACKGLRNIFGQKIILVPISEMTDVLSVESKTFANGNKGHFMKGDAVIVVEGDLKNLKGWVEKVDEDNVHIRPEIKGLPKTLAVNEKELCKYFETGNHVKIVSGAQEGATGMVVKVEQHVLILISDSTKEHIHVSADDVVASSEVTTGVTRIGDYELRDLGDAYSRFPSLRTPPRIPQTPRRFSRGGPPIDFGGRHRGGMGHDGLSGVTVKVRQGPYKGYHGRVIEVKGSSVRVELESQMKVVTVDRNHISDNVAVTSFCYSARYGMGSETPMHPCQTPLHPYVTPVRDPRATPIHDGMKTPIRDRAWDPYMPTSPPRCAAFAGLTEVARYCGAS